MTSSDILKAVADQVNLPQETVNEICLSWNRDVYSLHSRRIARIISLNDLGYLYYKSYFSYTIMDIIVKDLEDTFEKYKPDLNLANERVREIVTLKVDNVLVQFSQMLQNIYFGYDQGSKYIKKNKYDFKKLDEYTQRFYRVIDALPCQLKRKEPSEIQKKALRSLLQAKAYIDLPDYLDCPMWPVRMFYRSKNSLYGLSMSAIVLERNKLIEEKRQDGIRSIAKHNEKSKKRC